MSYQLQYRPIFDAMRQTSRITPSQCPQELPAETPLLYYDENTQSFRNQVPNDLKAFDPTSGTQKAPPGYSFVWLESLSPSLTPSSTKNCFVHMLVPELNLEKDRSRSSIFEPERPRPATFTPRRFARPTTNSRFQKPSRKIFSRPKKSKPADILVKESKHEKLEKLLEWIEKQFGEDGQNIYNQMKQAEGSNVLRVDIKTVTGVDRFQAVLKDLCKKVKILALSTRSSLKRNKQRKGIAVYLKVSSVIQKKQAKKMLENNCKNKGDWVVKEIHPK
jgi:hypothetical protein